jgi:hypothetical protein
MCGCANTMCSGRCVDTNTDPANCGACGNRCVPGMNAAASCQGGVCSSTCATGTTMCGAACADTMTDTSNCGRCANACPTTMNGVANCQGGMCGFTCNPGFASNGMACVNDPCASAADGTDCQFTITNGICIQHRCVGTMANCESETYGSNWMPATPNTRWNWTVDNNAQPCQCNGNQLTDGIKSMNCTQCMMVATLLYMGGASNPDGITDIVYVCQ